MKMLYLASLALLCLAAAVDAVAVGGACDASKPCDANLVCDNKKCRNKLDAACRNNEDCVTNAMCKEDGGKKCKCNDKFVPTTDMNKCLKTIGQACAKKEECVPTSDCSGGKCACGDKKVASYAFDKCNAAPGQKCSVQNLDCIENAHCLMEICTCYSGFVFRNGERCGKAVGAECSADDECVVNADCTEKKCKCKADYTVDGQFCSGASAVLASVMLMLAALGASRWM